MKSLFILLLLGLGLQSAHGLELVIDEGQLTPEERIRAHELVNEAMARLPQKITSSLNMSVPVIFKQLDKNEVINVSCDPHASEGAKYGEMKSDALKKNYKIYVHDGFLKADPNTRISCFHKTVGKMALATILHEVVHIYDFKTGKVSSDPMFLSLGHWNPGIIKRRQGNKKTDRSPDPYEFKNPKEYLAVNFEYFLLDDEYQCRRPGMNSFLSRTFEHIPFREKKCRATTKFDLNLTTLDGAAMVTADIHPSRVYEVHYLLAGEGSAAMSKWGHAMFKLVLCAPERKVVGPDCLEDKFHHVVVGYRALIEGTKINSLKGVIGKYPSNIILKSYPEIFDEYARGELRSLHSIPLKFTKEEKDNFVWAAIEDYASYKGRYAFFTNNCADEALKLVKRSTANRAIQKAKVLTPIGLVEVLHKAGLTESKNYKSPEYTSLSELNNALDKFKEIAPYLNVKKTGKKELLAYLRDTSAEERRAIYQEMLSKNPSRKTVSAFLILEQNFIEPYWTKEVAVVIEVQREAYMKEINDTVSFTESREFNGSYGIPLQNEEPNLSNVEEVYKVLEGWNKTHQNFLLKLRDELKPALDELEQIKNNKSRFFQDYKRMLLQ